MAWQIRAMFKPGDDPEMDELVRASTEPMIAFRPEELATEDARTATLSPEETVASPRIDVREITPILVLLNELGIRVIRYQIEDGVIVCYLDQATDMNNVWGLILEKTRGAILKKGNVVEFKFGHGQQKRRIRLMI